MKFRYDPNGYKYLSEFVMRRPTAEEKSIKQWGEPRKCAYCLMYITDETCVKTVDGWVHHSCEYGKDGGRMPNENETGRKRS